MPVSVSLSEDNERLNLIEYSGFSVLSWETMKSWFSFVSHALKHENANQSTVTVCIVSIIPLVKVLFSLGWAFVLLTRNSFTTSPPES